MRLGVFANNLSRRGVGNITTVQVALLTKRNVKVTLITQDEVPRDLIKWSNLHNLDIVKIPNVGTGALQITKWFSLWSKITRYLDDADLIYVTDMWYSLGIYASRSHIPSVITVSMYWPFCHHEGLWYDHKPCSGCIWNIPYYKMPIRVLDCIKPTSKFMKCLTDYYSRSIKLVTYKYFYSMFKKAVIDYSLKYFDKIIAISHIVKKKLIKKYPELHNKVVVVNLGALLLPYEPPYVPPTNADELRMLYMSAPIEVKGIYHLIWAIKLALCRKHSLKFKLKIIGGKGNKLIEKLVKPISNHVELYPWMPREVFLQKIQAIIRDVDIVIVPSIWEDTWAGVTTLAMALGRPILVHDGGALREQVINGINGFRVNCSNVKEFADKIVWLSELNRNILRDMGIRARKIYLRKWAPDVVIQKLINTFKEIMEKLDNLGS